MVDLIKQTLIEWNGSSNQRLKLQKAYLLLVVVSVMVAGLVSLIDFKLGRTLLTGSFVLALVYAINAVTWALLDTLVSDKIRALKKTQTTNSKKR